MLCILWIRPTKELKFGPFLWISLWILWITIKDRYSKPLKDRGYRLLNYY